MYFNHMVNLEELISKNTSLCFLRKDFIRHTSFKN